MDQARIEEFLDPQWWVFAVWQGKLHLQHAVWEPGQLIWACSSVGQCVSASQALRQSVKGF
jgi:hypothetical protein